MEKIKRFITDLFFQVGERLAIILVFLVAGFLFFSQSSHEAFSQTESPNGALYINGLLFDTMPPDPVPAFILNASPTPTPTDTPTPTPIPPTPTETLIPLPTATPTPTVDPQNDAIWDSLASCESNGNWRDDTGNGYFGGLQFSQSAWQTVGGSGNPSNASRDEQIARGKLLQVQRGWGVWGVCARRLGLH